MKTAQIKPCGGQQKFQSSIKLYQSCGPGYSCALYQLDESNLINDIYLPKRFHCDNLALTHYFGANIYSRYDGIVTNYAPGQNGGLMPELRGPVSVQDRRIRDQNLGNHMWRRDVTSILHNDAWIIDTNDAMIHSAAKFPSATRYIVVAVVARRQNECLIGQAVFWLCMISLPVILLWKHIKSRPKSAEIFRPTD